ncbi:neuronal acetylcholine receptor subunit beta-3-like isoform X2 [Symsagittifera roscoffensis]|uniref:neuronal acetylcholine receptor subunit beta-3-like isoform X2 n=1 Tax=Symsagittifera roscoffensis TaxID=84072 RepID=UPI00307BBE46
MLLIILLTIVCSVCSQNMDANITKFVEKYLPLTHRPGIVSDIVYVFADIYNIIDVNEREETITTKLWLYVGYVLGVDRRDWDDYFPELYEFYPGSDSVWLPDIVVLNGLKKVSSSFKDPVVMRLYDCNGTAPYDACPVNPDGILVVFPLALTQKTTCTFDVTDFPFDTQYCNIEIGPWFTDMTTFPRALFPTGLGPFIIQHPVPTVSSMSLESYIPNSQWDLVSARMTNTTRKARLGSTLKEFEVIVYTLEMRRKPQFFVYTLVLPCLILTLLTVLSVLLPVESGEKMGLGVTILLAQVVNLMILSGLIPTSSQNFPELGYYFLITISLIALSLLYNAVIMSIYFYDYANVLGYLKSATSKVEPRNQADSEHISSKNPGLEIDSKLSLETSLIKLVKVIQETKNGVSNESNERRQKLCAVADHLFAIILFVIILIVHVVFFIPHA